MKKKLYIVASVLVCLLGSGCGDTDRAITFSVGESIAENVITSAHADEKPTSEGGVSEAQEGLSEADQVLYIYVCGAVNNPGVVVLPQGSRCNDALEAAGGFLETAAREAVNLAELLTDGEQIYFPTQEEYEAEQKAVESEQAGRININEAGQEILCTLPGIGEAKAKAIIAYREENGKFVKTEDIMQVPGIKKSAYNQICDLITVQ